MWVLMQREGAVCDVRRLYCCWFFWGFFAFYKRMNKHPQRQDNITDRHIKYTHTDTMDLIWIMND